MPHEIRIIRERKKDFLELLLLADEQENMIDLYLDRGELFALYDGGLKSVCVVIGRDIRYLRIEEPRHTARIPETGIRTGTDTPHLAILPRTLPDHARRYGRTPAHSPFTNRADSSRSHRIPDFFTDHYHHSIVEEGITLKDMIYLKKEL